MIKIGICGYGNLGRGVETAVNIAEDMELVGIFTRRAPDKIDGSVKAYSVDELDKFKNKIDVLILCGGSATDLIVQSPAYARSFNIVDSFDTHAKIPEHFTKVDKEAIKGSKVAVISAGWDPGLFSINRLYAEAVLPNGNTYTFWGKGVSQGHSDAIRRVEGVKNGVQYTIPIEDAINRVRKGENPDFETREKHIRVCYIVAEKNANKQKIEEEIKNMPNYFDQYNTEVYFITDEVLKQEHGGMPHGGFVMRNGKTGDITQHYEFSLNLGSNPLFTSSVLVSYARASYRLSLLSNYGAKTVFEIPPYLLSEKSIEELRETML